jgi:tRNA (cmo5U34)-methyltransferase
MDRNHRDDLYASRLDAIVDFRFDESVAGVFPDMIQRSVPGYSTVISMIGTLAAEYARSGSRCYDLGCSVGAATLAMLRQIKVPDCRIVAIDNAAAMIEHCRANIRADMPASESVAVDLVCADIRDVKIENASVVVLNYTLQFVPLEQRADIITRIYQGLRPGGVMLLAEKIRFADAGIEQQMIDLHHAFKRANGYSDLEISQKRSALDNVLIPETIGDHMERLTRAGFSRPQVWFQCLNFISILAVK